MPRVSIQFCTSGEDVSIKSREKTNPIRSNRRQKDRLPQTPLFSICLNRSLLQQKDDSAKPLFRIVVSLSILLLESKQPKEDCRSALKKDFPHFDFMCFDRSFHDHCCSINFCRNVAVIRSFSIDKNNALKHSQSKNKPFPHFGILQNHIRSIQSIINQSGTRNFYAHVSKRPCDLFLAFRFHSRLR